MNKKKAPQHHSTTHQPTGEGPYMFAAKEQEPDTAALFDVIDDEHCYLPYDPDTIVNEVLEKTTLTQDSATINTVTEELKAITGIEIPDIALTQADITLQSEYNTDTCTILLHLIKAHGAVLRDGLVELTENDYPTITHTANREPRPIIATRVAKRQAHYSALHLGQLMKNTITNRLFPSTETKPDPQPNDKHEH